MTRNLKDTWQLIVEGEKPRAWPRPRPRFRGHGYITLWKPFHGKVRKAAWDKKPTTPIDYPVRLILELRFAKKNLKENFHPWNPKRPDLDNLVKGIGDMLEQAEVLADDSLISEIWASKVYAKNHGVSISIVPLP